MRAAENAEAISAAAPTRPSRAALIAGLLTVVEGLILLAFAGFYVYEIALGAEDSLTTALTSAALIVIFGVALLVVARAWLRGQRWPRTPTLVWNVLLVPVAWSLRDSDQTLIAAGIAAVAVASIVAALASPAHRLVEPGGLVDKDGVWYLLAGTDRGRRTYRVDRIIAADTTDELFERPADFDLGTAWGDVVEEMEGRRSRVWATVLVDPRHVPILADQFGRHCHEVGLEPAGRARLRLGGSIPLDLARILAGWGSLVEVLEPQSVRDLLSKLGTELVVAYS